MPSHALSSGLANRNPAKWGVRAGAGALSAPTPEPDASPFRFSVGRRRPACPFLRLGLSPRNPSASPSPMNPFVSPFSAGVGSDKSPSSLHSSPEGGEVLSSAEAMPAPMRPSSSASGSGATMPSPDERRAKTPPRTPPPAALAATSSILRANESLPAAFRLAASKRSDSRRIINDDDEDDEDDDPAPAVVFDMTSASDPAASTAREVRSTASGIDANRSEIRSRASSNPEEVAPSSLFSSASPSAPPEAASAAAAEEEDTETESAYPPEMRRTYHPLHGEARPNTSLRNASPPCAVT
mmetsp:Transcript_10740/g.31788  ORF Transcript_10740/g.31788 Transcript_10740/m.31788 type:complete len:298 (-) Transcript_10740:328-1221(-)